MLLDAVSGFCKLGFSRCLQRQLCFVFWLFRGRLIRFIFVGDTFGRIWITAQARFGGYGSFKNIRTFPYFERSTSQVTSRPPSPPPHSTAVRLHYCCQLTVSPTLMVLRTYASGADRNHAPKLLLLVVPGNSPIADRRMQIRSRSRGTKFVHFASCKHWLFPLLGTPSGRPGSGWLVDV